VLYKPHGFDASERYPVLDDIYPGPQANAAPVSFPGAQPMTPAGHAASMAALGFVVVVVDGRGTPLRDKAFQDATRKDRDIVLQDHVAAIRQLAETRPWLDLDRVGIYGHSGGGWASTRGVLTHPGFYKVAVSMAGDHDDATYHAMWGERFFGTDHDYAAASNSALVDRLEGKLLLIHGDLDDNVTPHLTIRLVDAFMAADKDVDLLVVPNSNHLMLTHQHHWIRRRWDYFVQHLMGEPPPSYRLSPLPVDASVLEDLMG
jgi:dipeptidyl aminopeptidase/acylaminoacyl peptidase